MEDLSDDTYCQRAALELTALVLHQRHPRGHTRRDSALLHRCMEEVLARIPGLERLLSGPWRVGQKPLRKPGRGGLSYIPLVRRGKTVVMVTTPREAQELTAFLNFCGTPEVGTK